MMNKILVPAATMGRTAVKRVPSRKDVACASALNLVAYYAKAMDDYMDSDLSDTSAFQDATRGYNHALDMAKSLGATADDIRRASNP